MSEATIAKGKKWTDELKARFDNFDKKARLPLVLKNVHIYYLCHKEGGVKKFGATGNTLLDKEYCVQVLINEKIQKQLKKLHKKTAVKEYDAKEFFLIHSGHIHDELDDLPDVLCDEGLALFRHHVVDLLVYLVSEVLLCEGDFG